MGPPESYLELTRDYFEKKIRAIESITPNQSKYPYNTFSHHSTDVIKIVKAKLREADVSKHDIIKINNYSISWFYLARISRQIECLKLVENSMALQHWDLLREFTLNCAKRLDMKFEPLAFFGREFYCTGSFAYPEYGRKLINPFFQVSCDNTDPSMFWISLAHEVGHCKFSQLNLSEIEKKLVSEGLNKGIYKRQMEETLCDGLATYLFGFSYPLAFFMKFWLTPPSSANYPNFDFRISFMLELLKKSNFEIPKLAMDFLVFDKREAKKEYIEFLRDDLITICIETVSEPADYTLEEINKITNASEMSKCNNIETLYNSAWLLFLQRKTEIDELTKEVHCCLEG
ncbi:MAG: hypothetical protein ACE5J5_00630, partial [Candidatus Hydrothermarchaeales archaeon]